jgi:hypothetical protein
MIQSDHHESYILAISEWPMWPKWPRTLGLLILLGLPSERPRGLAAPRPLGLPLSRESAEVRGPALLLRRSPPLFCQGYNTSSLLLTFRPGKPNSQCLAKFPVPSVVTALPTQFYPRVPAPCVLAPVVLVITFSVLCPRSLNPASNAYDSVAPASWPGQLPP